MCEGHPACFPPPPADITLWGMELGLLSMRRGELARFLLSPRYAYGALGCPPLIPPEATVLFEIELLDFLDSAESDDFCALSAVSFRGPGDPAVVGLRGWGASAPRPRPRCPGFPAPPRRRRLSVRRG